ncbi:MAG: universal stress protein [Deltaproteobacteria bacterium]|nr:universal stress protein [Deltaproteobacteria bacterium]
MSRLRRIVVGYTFAADGELALHSALTLAERSHAALYLLHVVEPYPVYIKMRFPSVPAAALLEEVVLKTRAQLKELAERVQPAEVQVETDVRIGKPFVELISTCRTWQGDLVVVGTTQQGEERFLGSTGERVLRKAPVPVLVAKRELPVGPKTILVPTDFSLGAQPAAAEALALVRGFGGRIVFLHVLDIHYIYPAGYGAETVLLPPLTPEDLEPDWQEFLHELPLGSDVLWEKQTREGHAAQTIADTADEIGADLVVIGTHGRSGLAHMLLGSVAEQVLRSTTCSVLTVRPDAFRFELP